MDLKTILITLCLTAALCSCSKPASKTCDVDAMVKYIPVQTSIDGRWGMMSTDGVLIFGDEFTDRPGLAVNSLFSVAEGHGYSLYAVNDQPRLVGDCENMNYIGIYNEGLVPVYRDGERINVLGSDGSTVFTLEPINGKEIVSCAAMFSNGLLVVTNADGLVGTVNDKGEPVVSPRYALINDYSEGYAVAVRPNGQYVILDKEGNEVCGIKAGYAIVSRFVNDNDFIVSDAASHIGFMNIDGSVTKLPGKVKAVGDYNKDVFTFQAENELWGLMSRHDGNDMLMRPKFKYIKILNNNTEYLVNLDDTWSIINIQGKKIVDFDDTYTTVVPTGFNGAVKFLAKDPAGWILLNEQGKPIHTPFSIYDLAYNVDSQSQNQLEATFQPSIALDEEIVKHITPNSLCGIQLNAIANGWYREQAPDEYVNAKEFTPDSLPDIKTLGEATVIGVTDKNISVPMRFNTTTQSIEYAFMPNNTVNAIELDIVAKKADDFSKVRDSLIQTLVSQGYRLVEEAEGLVLLRSQYANLELSYDDEDKTITVLMYRL